MKYIEILLFKFLKWHIRRGYGADCETSDLDDFEEDYKKSKMSEVVSHNGRCGSCRARETIVWIDQHIDLLKM